MVKWTVIAVALAFAASGTSAGAEGYDGPVAVVVAIPIPAGLSREKIETLFRQQAPAFAEIASLKQKYFTINEATHRAGGIYLWVNAEAARAFYDDPWHARVKAAYGADAEMTWFDAPVIIQGKAGMTP
jgi:hypothetical protein